MLNYIHQKRPAEFLALFIMLLTLGFDRSALSDEPTNRIRIEHAFGYETQPGATIGVAYMIIKNDSIETDRLISASSPIAANIGIREKSVRNNTTVIRKLRDGLPIGPRAIVPLAPGGYYLALEGLNGPLKNGDRLPMRLKFMKAGTVDITVDVEEIGAQIYNDMIMPPTGSIPMRSDHMDKM
jgi:copper(I)-binding protein